MTTTSTAPWVVLPLPSVTCALPKSHTYQTLKAKYDEVRKKYPNLTPAAWRKAAAQELGMPYDDFLAIWKTKGKVPLVPLSTPTVPAAQATTVDMGLTEVPTLTGKATSTKINYALKDSPFANLKAYKNPNMDGYLIDVPSYVDMDGIIKTLQSKGFECEFAGSGYQVTIWGSIKAPKITGVVESAGEKVIQTKYGPLTHDLVKNTFAKMKVSMPGATPAQLRHAAAEYLDVDYNDFLKAWKIKTPKSVKVPTTADLPPLTEPPVTAGVKYGDQFAPSASSLQNDLVSLYGPSANPAYMVINEVSPGVWTTTMPSSILSPAGMEKVAQELKKLGLKVEQSGAKLTISGTGKAAKLAAKKAAEEAKAFGGIFTSPEGLKLWDRTQANKWSDKWWSTLRVAEKDGIRKYSGSAYKDWNKWLRKDRVGEVWDKEALLAAEDALARTKVEHEFVVFRGASHSFDMSVGDMWRDKGFTSTAITKGSAWSGSVQFEIHVTKGTRGAYIDPHSVNRGENEFLLAPGTKFRVVAIAKQGTVTRVRLVTVP